MKIEKIHTGQSIVDYALEMAIWANQIAWGQIGDINKTLDQLEKQIAAMVLALDSETIDTAGKRTITKLLSDMRNAETAAMSQQLTETVSTIGQMTNVIGAAEVAVLTKLTKRQIKALTDPFKVALDTPIAAAGEMLGGFVEGLEDAVSSKMERTIRMGMANKWTLQETVRAMRDNFDVIKRRDVEAVVQTACHHAFESARMAVYKANKIDQVQCVITLDTRTCRSCFALGGMIVDIDKAPRYPLHPRCRCVTIPWLPELAEYDEGATRASMGGYVDANVSSFDWFKKHDKAWLNEVFGPTIANVIKKQGMTEEKFRRLALDRTYRPRTIKQIEQKAAEMGLL